MQSARRDTGTLTRVLLPFMEDLHAPRDIPIVCVGGSAGGLQAYIRLLQHFPADLGIAVVIVNHVRRIAATLHQILPRYTSMPVELITERLLIAPNRVYIIPANRDLRVLEGTFRLAPISKPWGWPDVITIFLRSLATCWEGKLIAIIVSGYDGDGAAALCEIKAVGGITIAQRSNTAMVQSMPREAIASGCIDLVLAPQEMGPELARIIREVSP
jgi:two-component system chemotaxis response regulator CheB